MKIPGPITIPRDHGLQVWCNKIRDAVISLRLRPGVNYGVREKTLGTFLDINLSGRGKGNGGGSSDVPRFTLMESTVGDVTYVTVKGGTVFWQDQWVIVADSSPIVVPAPSTHFYVYLKFASEFTSPPTITVESGASGWSGYPATPLPPNPKYRILADCALAAPVGPATRGVLTITEIWGGGDIEFQGPYGVYY